MNYKVSEVMVVTEFKKNLNFKRSYLFRENIAYSEHFISNWFLVDSNGIKDDVPPLAEKVEEDLFLAYERAKTEMEDHHVLRFVARFGRIIFHGCEGGPVGEGFLKNSKKWFSADVPTSYLEQIKSKVLPRHGFCLDEEKETFLVKVY